MTAPGTPKASQAAVAAVQEALGCYPDECGDPACECHATARNECMEHDEPMTERGCPVAVAAADAAAPWIAAAALRDAARSAAKEGGATVTHGYVAGWLRERADRIEAADAD